jgi:hypothetical protein
MMRRRREKAYAARSETGAAETADGQNRRNMNH